jgi:inorganic pyrophosphatase
MYRNEKFNRWRRHPWHGLYAHADGSRNEGVVQVYVEMLPTDVVKYELDKALGLSDGRPPAAHDLQSAGPYGFIPRTYCAEEVAKRCPGVTEADGDPLDICVYSERHINRSDIVLNARVVGGIQMIDGGEADDKIIAILDGDNIWGDATTSPTCRRSRSSACSTTSRPTSWFRARRSTSRWTTSTAAKRP